MGGKNARIEAILFAEAPAIQEETSKKPKNKACG
jgi:hypothetical protein